jgi:2-C-methyl-D-erythritol 4-phosphate cytidylyltransferase
MNAPVLAAIFAGGVGSRMGENFRALPKQFIPINGRPILAHTLEIFQRHPRLGDILDAHDAIRHSPTGYEDMVDACTMYRALGRPVRMVRGNHGNIKVTTPEDVYVMRSILKYRNDADIFGGMK